MNALVTFDIAISRWSNSWTGVFPFLDSLFIFLATYLWYLVMAAAAIFVAATFLSRFRDRRRLHLELFTFIFVSAFTARFIVTEIIRFFYNRPRPFEVLEGVRQLVDRNGGGSFPSGHAALAFAVATAVSFYYPKTSILFFIAAFAIGGGRVSAGVHWPSDIWAGAMVGAGTALLLRWISKKMKMTAASRQEG